MRSFYFVAGSPTGKENEAQIQRLKTFYIDKKLETKDQNSRNILSVL